MDKAELIMRRRNVREFIRADSITITITRKAAAVKNTLTGGYTPGIGTPLAAQKARIVQNVRRYTAGIVNSEAGDIPNSEYRLIGLHTMDIEVDDVFLWLGENYRVIGIHEARQESVFAAIQLLGADNRG